MVATAADGLQLASTSYGQPQVWQQGSSQWRGPSSTRSPNGPRRESASSTTLSRTDRLPSSPTGGEKRWSRRLSLPCALSPLPLSGSMNQHLPNGRHGQPRSFRSCLSGRPHPASSSSGWHHTHIQSPHIIPPTYAYLACLLGCPTPAPCPAGAHSLVWA